MSEGITRLLRRATRGRPVIVVSGLPRSGTSMVMQMLVAGGLAVSTDSVRSGDEDNPRGYFELERVKELPKGGDRSWLKECRGRALKVVSPLLRDLPRNLNYRVLFIERDLDEILRSQKKMLRRRGETDDGADDGKLRADYEKHLENVRSFMSHTPGFETRYLRYREIVERPEEAARGMNAFLGGRLDERAMAGAVDGSLYRNRPEGGGRQDGC